MDSCSARSASALTPAGLTLGDLDREDIAAALWAGRCAKGMRKKFACQAISQNYGLPRMRHCLTAA
jgi:hypothetical protein